MWLTTILALMVTNQELTTSELGNRLFELEQAYTVLETEFVMTVLNSRPLDVEGPWSQNDYISRRRYDWLSYDGLLRLREVELGEWGVVAEPTGDFDFVSVWTGSQWRDRRSDGSYSRIRKVPPFTLRTDCFAFFNSIAWASIAGYQPLSDAIRSSRLLEQTSEGAVHRFRFSRNPLDTAELDLVVDTSEDPIRLLSVTLDIKGVPGGDHPGQLKRRISYVVDEWGVYDDMVLPKRARRDTMTYISKVGAGRPYASRTVFERISARNLSNETVPPSVFSLPFQPGDTVMNDPLKIAYELGSKQLAVDGFVFSMREPVAEGIAGDLPQVLGEPLEFDDLVPTSTSGATLDGQDAIRRALVSGCVGLGIGILALVCIRRVRLRWAS